MASEIPARPPTDLELMLLADGELDAVRAREIAAAVERDPMARRKLAALGQLRESVRTQLELEVDDAEAAVPELAEMWADVERRLDGNGHRAEAGAAPASGAPGRRAGRPSTAGLGLWTTTRAWLSGHRGHILSGLVSAGAVAALMIGLQRSPALDDGGERVGDVRAPRRTPVIATPVSGAVPCGEPGVPRALPAAPPEVEDFEVYGGTGTVFTLPGDGDDGAAAVIWIDKDTDVEGPI